MINILYLYLILLVVFSLFISKKGTFYIFSPFLIIYFSFAVNDIIPMLMYEDVSFIPANLKYVTTLTAIINIASLIIFRKQLIRKVVMNIPNYYRNYSKERKYLFIFFILLMCLAGGMTGTTSSLLGGVDVENSRMTTDIGMGVLRVIPAFGIPYILLIYFLINQKLSFVQRGLICLAIGLVFFATTAARGGILIFVTIFFIWFNVKKRGFKWYEYFSIYYILSPIIALFLFLYRNANLNNIVFENSIFSYQQIIFGANTISLMTSVKDSTLLWGESFYYDLVKIIPRFLWPDKPTAIDYKYKSMVDMDFDGGGIFTTIPNDFYLNFGVYYFIPYILWILIIHFFYKKLSTEITPFSSKMFYVIFLSLYANPRTMIGSFEVYCLFLILCYFIYKKWKIA